MSNVARFAAYAAAFEKSFESDDWAPVRDFFAPDAVYDAGSDRFLGGRFEGRDAIVRYFKDVLDGFDRKFETRDIALLEGPRETDDTVWIKGTATYRSPGVPDLELLLEESVTFDADGLITRLEDRYEDAMIRTLEAYLDAHAETLGIAL